MLIPTTALLRNHYPQACMAKPHHNILQLTVAAALILFISFTDSLISGAHHHKTGSARHMLYGRQEA